VANENVISKDKYKQYCKILLDDLPAVIAYFKSLGIYAPEKFTEINNRVQGIKQQLSDLKQQMSDVEQKYNQFVFNNETSDINPLRGDNGLLTYYNERYSNILMKKRHLTQQLQDICGNPLWQHSKTVELLTELLKEQVKIQEIYESIAWQNSEAYKSMHRYDGYDNDDAEEEINYEQLAQQHKKNLDYICEICLNYPDIVKYIEMSIANKCKRNIQNSQNPRHTR
jgi:hypothetical protein